MKNSPQIQKITAQKPAAIEAVPLDEVVWQKWVRKNEERDARGRKRLFRMLWLALPIGVLSVVVWESFISK